MSHLSSVRSKLVILWWDKYLKVAKTKREIAYHSDFRLTPSGVKFLREQCEQCHWKYVRKFLAQVFRQIRQSQRVKTDMSFVYFDVKDFWDEYYGGIGKGNLCLYRLFYLGKMNSAVSMRRVFDVMQKHARKRKYSMQHKLGLSRNASEFLRVKSIERKGGVRRVIKFFIFLCFSQVLQGEIDTHTTLDRKTVMVLWNWFDDPKWKRLARSSAWLATIRRYVMLYFILF
jgi:hypothetical protein